MMRGGRRMGDLRGSLLGRVEVMWSAIFAVETLQ